MIKDNRLHRLVEFLIREDPKTKLIIKYDWKYEDLTKAIKGSTIYEISELCKTLHADNIVTPYLPGGEHDINVNSDNLRNAREAYHSKKYKEKIEVWKISNLILGIINIGLLSYSTIREYKTDDRVDRLEQDTVKMQVLSKHVNDRDSLLKRQDKEIKEIQKSLDSLDKILKVGQK
jgi:hypothetical protein